MRLQLSWCLLSRVFVLLALLALPAPGWAAPLVLGVDVLFQKRMDLLANKRIGLLTNASAVDGDLVATLDRFLGDKRLRITQLYAPEHGLGGALPNGASGPSGIDVATLLPLEGLFGKRTSPSPESLARIDVLVFDMQDVGSRTYTYATTLGKVMTAAAAAKVHVIVLDRPNPQGGTRFEGPLRTARYKSLIGWGPLPVTHGMTLGELARFYNGELKLGCQLTVVDMEGWRRDMQWEDTGLYWIPSSPGIPHSLNAHFYVATGMVGGSGANVNEGGGHSMPFELIGAPYLHPKVLAAALTAEQLPGVRFRPMTFRPHKGQFTGRIVHGVQLILVDRKAFWPLRTAIAILTTLQRLYPEEFRVVGEARFGRVWGNDEVLAAVRAGKPWREIEASWQAPLAKFAEQRKKYLVYP